MIAAVFLDHRMPADRGRVQIWVCVSTVSELDLLPMIYRLPSRRLLELKVCQHAAVAHCRQVLGLPARIARSSVSTSSA